MPNTITISPTAFEHLLSNLEAALGEEAQRRYTLAAARETLVMKEAKTSLEEREDARARDESNKTSKKTTEAEIEALVRINEVVLEAEHLVREEQLRYDLGKMLAEIARYRVQFALSVARSSSGASD